MPPRAVFLSSLTVVAADQHPAHLLGFEGVKGGAAVRKKVLSQYILLRGASG